MEPESSLPRPQEPSIWGGGVGASFLSQINPFHSLPTDFFKIQFDIIFISRQGLSGSLAVRLLHQKSVLLAPHINALRPTHSLCLAQRYVLDELNTLKHSYKTTKHRHCYYGTTIRIFEKGIVPRIFGTRRARCLQRKHGGAFA